MEYLSGSKAYVSFNGALCCPVTNYPLASKRNLPD
jgi:hypothetical protein